MRTICSPPTRIVGRLGGLSGAALAIAAIGVLGAPASGANPPTSVSAGPSPSDSGQVYVYWSFWTSADSTWVSSSEGPANTRPTDGSVQGWRYGPGPEPSGSQTPRSAPDFQTACAGTPGGDGFTRVAVFVDFGPASIAPEGNRPPGPVAGCARVATGSNGLQALAAIAAVRQDSNGMVCGVNGYPASGCSAQVPAADLTGSGAGPANTGPANTGSTAGSVATTSASWIPFACTLTVAALLMAASVVMDRRRRG